MKRLAIVALITVLGSRHMNAQWVQTSLGDAQYGYNLFSDNSGVWAATLNGVSHTTDTGNPWFSWGLANRLVFDVIKSGPYLLAATEGSGPGVFRTSDNGANWLPSNGITDQSVRAFTKNSSFVFACTWGGGIFRSSDNGVTWQSLGLTNHGFRSMFTVGEEVFAGGDGIFFSTDNGTAWTGRQLPYPAGDTWCFTYHNGRLYAGDMGLYSSGDLGMTWTLVYGVTFDVSGTVIDTRIFRDLVSYNQTLVASMSPGGIAISQDNGASWAGWNDGVMSDWTFAALTVKSPNIWTLRGFFGNAYLRPLSDIATGVDDAGGSPPTAFQLLQNYPNPFNPSTTIRYGLPNRTHMTLTVFNTLGEQVALLQNGEQAAGYHQVPFDGTDLSSGVYFYRLQAGNFVETRKFLFLR
jgi:hypothetical protein